eukprot:TRINITY_DN23537_c0_g1_i1.p1 TRINITY_DN23537_c0_g1~~TRINITY_DN23537_c0_g1_i1.p1  ORF type:complete len:197 (-),score=40.12 TRINITY_DN23537_c0_g1_i1:68-637(-)
MDKSKSWTCSFELFEGVELTVLLFVNIQNATNVLNEILRQPELYPVSLLNPKYVSGLHHVQIAANRALYSNKSKQLVTKSLNVELIYNMAAEKNMKQNLKKFGVSEESREVLVGLFNPSQETIDNLCKLIQGEQVDVKLAMDKKTYMDPTLIKKHFKISDAELQLGSLEEAVVGRVAMHGTNSKFSSIS